MAVRDKFLAVRAELNSVLLERSSAIDNALLALVSGEHFLQLGPPGSGKSLLVRALTLRIEGAQYFEKLMSSFTVPEELFGPIDLVGYADRGEYRRIAAGSLSQAHVAMLDEFFKSNSAILNSLLTILNERLLHEVGQSPQRVPLLSLFAASNETPQDDSLRALDDRFLLREVVLPIQDEQSFFALIAGKLDYTDVRASVTLDDIVTAQGEVKAVKGSVEVLQALSSLRTALSTEGIVVSDRKWRQAGKLIKAQAWLEGQQEMDVEHLICLIHALWTDPKEQATVTRLVYEIACPLSLRAVEIEDSAAELMSKLPKADHYDYNAMAENALVQLSDMYNTLKGELDTSSARNTERATQALSKVHAMHKSISAVLYKAISRMSLHV